MAVTAANSVVPLYAEVVFNLPLDRVFTYVVTEPGLAARLAVGKRVLAPFSGRRLGGWLIGVAQRAPELPAGRELLPLTAVVDEEPLFGPGELAFYRRAAAYYQAPLGEALATLLPGGLDYRPEKWLAPGPKARAGERSRSARLNAVLEVLRDAGEALELSVLCRRLPDSPGAAALRSRIGVWARAGWLELEERLRPPAVRVKSEEIFALTDPAALQAAVAAARFRPEKKARLLAFLKGGAFFSRRSFRECFPGDTARLREWCAKGWLAVEKVPVLRGFAGEAAAGAGLAPEVATPVTLTPAQERVLAAIRAALPGADPKKATAAAAGGGSSPAGFVPWLLHGVTGSGKTEIYIRLTAAVLERGGTVLYLVPEIALTFALVERLVREFGPRVALLHSALSPGERYDQWRRIAAGRARIVVGARSAVFAPLPDLGLVIVDEEHEPSFKHEGSGFAYHGRDLALLRGQMAACPVVLGSATPSLVSYENARRGRYRLLEMPERPDARPMPRVEIVDLGAGRERLFAWDGFSPRLLERMKAVLEAGRQVMLFLNQRGFSRTLYCLRCGAMPECKFCSVHLTFHKDLGELVCHYCGSRRPLPESCPECGAPRLFPLGLGLQKLEEGLARYFPGVGVLRLDRDVTRRKGELGRILGAFARGEAGILLGTQMLAKGHNFPGVDLVGVIFADLSLEIPEYSAPERTFQLLAQVSGRAGRAVGNAAGEVIIQTLQPEHYAIRAAARHDFAGFFAAELKNRRELGFPPFSHLANLRASGPDQEAVRGFLLAARESGRELLAGVSAPAPLLLGPVPAAIVRVRNRYRWNLLVKSADRPALHSFLRCWRPRLAAPRTVAWRLDIDPVSFF